MTIQTKQILISADLCSDLYQGTVLLYGGALAIIGMLFHLYAPAPSCKLNIFFIAWTLILGISTTLLSARMPGLPVGWMCSLFHAGS